MSDTKPPAEPPLGPREALVHIRKLIRIASQTDDMGAVRKLLEEMLNVVDKALPPHRRR
jgi:hypothetical protein